MRHRAILIIDDHALVRSGIAAMLSTALDDVAIVDRGSLDEALTVEIVPAVILLDIRMPGTGGLEGIGLIRQRWPAARIVIISADDQPVTVEAALARGAAAFLSKADRPERMMVVLHDMLEWSSAAPAAHGAPGPSLTPRQVEVLALVERGLSNKAIGRRLDLSEHTVRGHVQALLSALGAASRAEAAFMARQLGLVR